MASRILDRRAVTLGLAGALCMPSILRAQTNYPDRPINVIVPFAAGGPTDAIARIYAEFISRDLGQTLVIENVAGAGGTIGSTRAARATPDGYTIQIGQAGTHVSSVGLYKNLKYNPITDYEHLGLLGDLPQVLIVKRDLPPDNFKAFVEYVRANEAKLNAGTAGPGSSAHMGAAMLNVRLGTKVNLVSYRGTGPAMNDLIAGQIDYMAKCRSRRWPRSRRKPCGRWRCSARRGFPPCPRCLPPTSSASTASTSRSGSDSWRPRERRNRSWSD
jgi:tripartite-type tricarboxylate transporter receptor subunit TctC